VIDSDQTGEHADGKNDWQRRKSRGEKRQPDHIGFARAPIAVEQRGCAFPINIARPMHRAALGDNQVSHRKWKPELFIGVSSGDKRFSKLNSRAFAQVMSWYLR